MTIAPIDSTWLSSYILIAITTMTTATTVTISARRPRKSLAQHPPHHDPTVNLSVGNHEFRLEYFKNLGSGVAQLSYQLQP